MRLALPLTIAALLLGLLAGCGGGSSSTGSSGGEATTQGAAEGPPGATAEDCGVASLRVSGVSCGKGEGVLASWSSAPGCQVVGGNSHASCKMRGYLCIAAQVQKGTAVSCAQPSESIFFIKPR